MILKWFWNWNQQLKWLNQFSKLTPLKLIIKKQGMDYFSNIQLHCTGIELRFRCDKKRGPLFQCQICNQEFQSHKKLSIHMLDNHRESRPKVI